MDATYAFGENLTIAKPPGIPAVENSYLVPGMTDGEISGLEWKDGIGKLPGSDLKFRRNERGEVEVIMEGINDIPNGHGNSEFSPLHEPGQITDLSTKGMKNLGWSDPSRMPVNVPSGVFFAEPPLTYESERDGTYERNGLVLNGHSSRSTIKIETHTHATNANGFDIPDEKPFQTAAEYNKRFNSPGPPPLLPADQRKVEMGRADPHQVRNDAIPQSPEFSWDRYLHEQNATAVPASVFQQVTGRQPFPPPIKFIVGDLLECVDPLHQSLICAVSVVEVKGFRMRLHFEGYSTLHDFWVNADDKLIFPCGFCEKTGRKLHPPKVSDPSSFQWITYANATGKSLAREEKFCEDFKKSFDNNSKFTIGNKLEAFDRQNPDLTCVATVTDIIDDRVLIHFDGWNHNFDYWCDHTSNYIHSIGWCRKVGKSLAVPQDYLKADSFSWSQYLKETASEAAPEEVFAPRISHGFEIGMKLEVVDKRNPILVRVATVMEKNSSRIKIHFDGWDQLYDYWIDVDSTDLHPAKWCEWTGHSLQPNITGQERQSWQGGCPVVGCRGLGHIKCSKFVGHHSEYGCPYSSKNLDSYPIQDRINPRRGPKTKSLMSRRMVSVTEKEKTRANANDRKRAGTFRRSSNSFLDVKERSDNEIYTLTSTPNYENEPPQKQRATEAKEEGVVSNKEKHLYYSLYSSSLWSSVPNKQLAIYWEQCTRLIQCFKDIRGSDVCQWSAKQVANFIENLTGREKYGQLFLDEEIDGEAFLLLTQNDIFKVMKIKLGPTLKIHGAILYARANE